ncbi:hypothetical protein [Haloarcula rubra]|nr:hypothetical protein [Halomicroarcula rubra]
MATNHSSRLPASKCPHCSGEFEIATSVGLCPDCGYVPGQGAD